MHPLQNLLTYLGLALPSIGVAHLAIGRAAVVPGVRASSKALLMGALGMCAQGLIFCAAPHCPAAQATLVASSEIIWSYVWQITLLRQPSDATSLVGAALILVSFSLPLTPRLCGRAGGDRLGALPRKLKGSDISLVTLDRPAIEATADELESLSTPSTSAVLSA